MSKMLLLNTEDEISVLDFPEEYSDNYTQKLVSFHEAINCNCIEIVRPQYIPQHFCMKKFVMVVDESGFMYKKDLNILGSILYGTPEHGSPIFGDILIVDEQMTIVGPELVGIEDKTAENLANQMQVLINYVKGISN